MDLPCLHGCKYFHFFFSPVLTDLFSIFWCLKMAQWWKQSGSCFRIIRCETSAAVPPVCGSRVVASRCAVFPGTIHKTSGEGAGVIPQQQSALIRQQLSDGNSTHHTLLSSTYIWAVKLLKHSIPVVGMEPGPRVKRPVQSRMRQGSCEPHKSPRVNSGVV